MITLCKKIKKIKLLFLSILLLSKMIHFASLDINHQLPNFKLKLIDEQKYHDNIKQKYVICNYDEARRRSKQHSLKANIDDACEEVCD